MKFLITLLLVSITISLAQAEIHAVLAAGSKGYSNYRHQSDICHAYQLLIQNGVKAENIILFAYNDIANNERNPFPGAIYNQPSGPDETSPNVYDGCAIDYEGDDVTPENFVAVLTGDASKVNGGNGRVLQSTSQDTVFINFDDHGEPGVMDFPEIGEWPQSKSQRLYADQMNEALQTMSDKKMFSQLTYYLETCYSGSIFEDTPNDIGVYAVSAANPHQSSWATYCSPQDVVQGVHIKSCLGDLFSCNWMENTQNVDTTSYTLQEQYEVVRDQTAQTSKFSQGSEVMQWGDLSFTGDALEGFLGNNSKSSNNLGVAFLKKMNSVFKKDFSKLQQSQDKFNVKSQGTVKTENVTTNYLLSRFQEDPSSENFAKLSEDLKATEKFNRVFQNFQKMYQVNGEYKQGRKVDFDCYRYLINSLESEFGPINDYSRFQFLKLYEFCSINQSNYKSVKFIL